MNNNIITLGDKLITWLFYLSFPLLLLIWLLAGEWNLFWHTLITCGIGFTAVSVFRRFYHVKRPCEEEGSDSEDFLPSRKRGTSFPSRHLFSAFIITACWFRYDVIIALLLLVCGVFLAYFRVALRLHYPIDVVVGALSGFIIGLCGMFIGV